MGSPEVLLRLLEISRVLTSETGTERVLERILDSAIEFTRAERGFLCLYQGESLEIVEARNLDREEVLDAHKKLSQSIVQHVVTRGEPLVSMDAGEDARLTDAQSIHRMGIRSVACIPLKVAALEPSTAESAAQPRVIGCVYVDHRFQTAQFLDADVELLEIFGAHASLAIRNASLMALLEEKNAQLGARLQSSEAQLHEAESLLKDVLADAKTRHDVPGVVYASRAMHEVLGLVKRVAEQDLPILIAGESGTGKEMLARGVHALSRRRAGPFVPVNCGAIAPELFESELFGHRRGSFTGADRDRVGLVEAASGGTLFLDEVSELSVPHQVKLLRVLQERELRRVGESQTRKVDFRVLSASNKDLGAEVQAGRFREDLFYRLRVFHVELPALRDRPEDIPLLVTTFAHKHRELVGVDPSDGEAAPPEVSPEALGLLANYTWPGNIRELENEVKRALALCTGAVVRPTDLSPHIVAAPRRTETWATLRESGRTLEQIVAVVEREVIRETLDRFAGNKSRTAQQLGISRNGLAMKMERLGLGSG
jgi:transcriptional regulator with GAF, ATPase, and Fis domain